MEMLDIWRFIEMVCPFMYESQIRTLPLGRAVCGDNFSSNVKRYPYFTSIHIRLSQVQIE